MTASTQTPLERIGIGIDTARYGHRVSFLRPDRKPATTPLTVLENQEGYQALQQRIEDLHNRHPNAHFHVRIDAAGQYATNLESFLRQIPLPMTISIGEPKRNKDYRKAHFPKRTTDDIESQAMARFAVVELPPATLAVDPHMVLLREICSRLQAQVKQSTVAINRLHNLMARVFPELATLVKDFSAGWLLSLLDKYPTPERIARAKLDSLTKLPYFPTKQAEPIHRAAKTSVGSLQGSIAETLVRELVTGVRHSAQQQEKLRKLLAQAYQELPSSGHQQLQSIPGIGIATAAVLVAKIVDIERFASADHLVGYFGIFPEENSSGVDPEGNPLPPGTMRMSHQGNDLVRGYLWNAARVALQHNPAVRALSKRLRAKGKRSDVAVGHCMRKLLHLVFAVWKTNRPFDRDHYPWEPAAEEASVGTPLSSAGSEAASASEQEAAGHTQALPAKSVVTPADVTVEEPGSTVKESRGGVDFGFVREQITMEQVLRHLDRFEGLRGSGSQRRGCCPVHANAGSKDRSFSVHLGKGAFQCFHSACGAQGNVLDLWAAVQQMPLYEATLHLCRTFGLLPNREEEPVKGTRDRAAENVEKNPVITTDGP